MNLEKIIYLSIQSEDSDCEDVADIDGTDLSWTMDSSGSESGED